MNDEESRRLIEWWFSGTQSERYHRWFGKNPKVDEFIMKQWGNILNTVECVCNGKFEQKQKLYHLNKNQLFGTILLLDQISR